MKRQVTVWSERDATLNESKPCSYCNLLIFAG